VPTLSICLSSSNIGEQTRLNYFAQRTLLSRGQSLAYVIDDAIEECIKDFFNRHREYINEMDTQDWLDFRKASETSDLAGALSDVDVLEENLPEGYRAQAISTERVTMSSHALTR
jgi:hypothetical protein